MSDEPVRLPARFEALLQAAPLPERDDWDALATQTDQRVRETEAKSTAPLWLMAPLPDEPHEPGGQARVAESQSSSDAVASQSASSAPLSSRPTASSATPSPPSSTSLADLARAVAQKGTRPESTRIAKESLSVVAAARAQNDALAERVRSARPTPPPRRGEPRASASVPPPAPSTVQARAAQSSPPSRRSDLGPWIAIGGLGFALAAALLVIARGREPAQIVVASPQAPTPAALAAPSPKPESPAIVQAPPPTEPTEPAVAAVPASALPISPKAVASASPRASAEQLALAPRAASGAGEAAAARPAPEAIQLEETPSKSKPLEATAAAPTPSGMRPAAGSTSGGLPSRPSTGAVQAAVGSVMGAARACVAGGVASPAQITFGSDGTVSSVSVSGPAAGTPAASCIEAALKRARVAPFTNPTFSLGVWVRP
ncbi:MAG: hypothetical protein ACOY0T_25400 [Myxococcota bacterium]